MNGIVDSDHLTVELDGQAVRVRGEIELAARPAIEEALRRARTDGPAVFDLDEVTFIDSAGLSCLLDATKREGGAKLGALSPAIRRFLELTNTDEMFGFQLDA